MMAQKIYYYIAKIIQNLTNDEDIQQELWLYVLEGNSPFTIKKQFHYIKEQRLDNNSEKIYGPKEII